MFRLKLASAPVFMAVYDNTIDPFIPKLWAEESLAILEENMVAGMLVHRDFEPIIANFGDTVNTRRPGQFTANRKTPADSVVVQDATATNVQVPLNQHIHVSFLIKDGEESKSFKDLVAEYMAPAMLAQARIIDQMLLGQAIQFADHSAGGLNQLTSSNARAFILNTRNTLNQNKAYMQNRNMILTPNSETSLLNLDLFTSAQQVGDDGTALREASLGRKLGFDMFMCQNAMSVPTTGQTLTLGAVNHSGGYSKGVTVLAVNTFSGALTNGQWVTIAGDNTPYRVVAHSETLGATTSITLHTGLRNAVSNSAVITAYSNIGLVNQAVSPAGYAIGYSKGILTDTFSSDVPAVGQPITFGVTNFNTVYTILQVTSLGGGAFSLLLDRPLDFAISDEDAVNLGPSGDYNFAFHRNSLALVVRPLAMPRPGTGALSAVVNYNDLSMRATITYDGNKQGHLVTLDMLCGLAVLDLNLGAVMFG